MRSQPRFKGATAAPQLLPCARRKSILWARWRQAQTGRQATGPAAKYFFLRHSEPFRASPRVVRDDIPAVSGHLAIVQWLISAVLDLNPGERHRYGSVNSGCRHVQVYGPRSGTVNGLVTARSPVPASLLWRRLKGQDAGGLIPADPESIPGPGNGNRSRWTLEADDEVVVADFGRAVEKGRHVSHQLPVLGAILPGDCAGFTFPDSYSQD